MGTLAQSMALMLEEFYKTLTAVGVSALTALSAFAVFGPAAGSAEGTPEGSDR